MAGSLRRVLSRVLTARGLRVFMWAAVAVWLAVQLIVIAGVVDIPQISDARVYQRLAEDCADRGVWYPTRAHIENILGHTDYPPYLCYPGLINLMALVIRLTGTYKTMFWVNMAFNCLVAAGIWRVGRRLAGVSAARLCVAAYCLMPYASLMVGETMSEFPCMGLVMLSLMLTRRGAGWLAAAAVVMMLAQYVRTVALFFALGAVVYMLTEGYGWKRVCVYVVSFALAWAALGAVNLRLSGHASFTSTTLGVNMRDGCVTPHVADMAANDSMIIAECTGLDVFQIDSIQRRWTLAWIARNPGRFALDAGPKLAAQLGSDSHMALGRGGYMPLDEVKPVQKGLIVFWLWYPKVYNAVLLAAMAAGIWIRRRRLAGSDGAVLLPFVCGLALAVLTKAEVRYNLPYTPCMIYFASLAALALLRRLRPKPQPETTD